MTVNEYREKNPDCRYCKHGSIRIVDDLCMCKAKIKDIFFTRFSAKRCKIYEPVDFRG